MTVPLRDGVTDWPEAGDAGDEAPGVVVVGYPNYLGCLEDLGAARRICDRTGALLVVAADPVAAGSAAVAGGVGRRRGGGGGAGVRDRPRVSAAPTSGCSPWPSRTCAACRAVWWARRSTSRARGPT